MDGIKNTIDKKAEFQAVCDSVVGEESFGLGHVCSMRLLRASLSAAESKLTSSLSVPPARWLSAEYDAQDPSSSDSHAFSKAAFRDRRHIVVPVAGGFCTRSERISIREDRIRES